MHCIPPAKAREEEMKQLSVDFREWDCCSPHTTSKKGGHAVTLDLLLLGEEGGQCEQREQKIKETDSAVSCTAHLIRQPMVRCEHPRVWT